MVAAITGLIVWLSAANISSGFLIPQTTNRPDSTITVLENGDTLVEYHPLLLENLVPFRDERDPSRYLLSEEDRMQRMEAYVNRQKDLLAKRAGKHTASRNIRSASDRSVYSVGAIPLEEGVSSSGARTYSIPVLTAVNIKHVPRIVLSYNSQAGEGLAGFGWDIQGIHTIELINKNLYYHGAIKAADVYVQSDPVFALDGIPLVTNVDPATCDDYPLVTARGHILAAPRCHAYVTGFDVLYPDGSQASFGLGYGAARHCPIYPIVQSRDILGNIISYTYLSPPALFGGPFQPSIIRYGNDSSGGYCAEIEFEYEDATDYAKRYYAGLVREQRKRLVAIESRDRDSVLCHYTLNYIQDSGVHLLSEVECSTDDGSQLPPLEFTYGESEDWSYFPSPRLYETDSLIMTTAFTSVAPVCKRGKFLPGSYNDGLIIYPDFSPYDVLERKWTLKYGYTYKFGSKYSASQTILLVSSIQDFPYVYSNLTVGSGFQTIDAADVDGDGLDELVKVNLNGTSGSQSVLKITVYKCNNSGVPSPIDSFTVNLNGKITSGSYTSPYRYSYHWGDFNGDGKAELLTAAFDYNYNSYHNFSQTCYVALIDIAAQTKLSDAVLFSFPLSKYGCLLTCDFDADSRTELCYATDSGLDVYRRQSTGVFSKEKTYSAINEAMLSSSAPPHYITDINGDGYADILIAPGTGSGSTWDALIFTGNTFSRRIITISPRVSDDEFLFIDLDRDGLTDLVRATGTTLETYPNLDGLSFGSAQASGCRIGTKTGILPSNLIYYNRSSSFIRVEGFFIHNYSFYPQAPEKRHLTSAVDSYGNLLLNTYDYLPADGRVWYDSSLASEIPDGFALRPMPIYILGGESNYLPDWEQRYKNNVYWYINGVSHNLGLGFCGFSKTHKADCIVSPATYTDTWFSPEKMGVVKKVETRTGGLFASPYSTVTNTWDSHSTTYGKLSPRLTLNVVADSLHGTTSTTRYYYDSFDYPTSITTTRRLGSDTSTNKSETLLRTYAHSNMTSRYMLGGVTEESVLKDGDGDIQWAWKNKRAYILDSLFRPIARQDFSGKYGKILVLVNDTTSHGHALPDQPGIGDEPVVIVPIYEYVTVDSTLLINSTRWSYDAFGNVISEKSAPYNATEFLGDTLVYDAAGRFLLSKTDALGHATTYSGYNKFGSPAAVTDYRGRAKTLLYDSWGNLLQTNYADGSVETISREWGGSGVYKDSTSCTGKPSSIAHYDALGRSIRKGNQRFDGQWQWVETDYNNKGLVSRVSLPYRTATSTSTSPSASFWNTYTYDSYDRVTSIAEASGRTTTWSYSGTSTTTVKDGITSTSTTDAAGNVISVTDAGGTIVYTLRDDGQPSSVTAPGNVVTAFSYDEYGRRVGMDDPSVGERTYSYTWNADGSSQTTQSGPNGSISTAKDKYGRTTSIVREDEFTTTYSYDTYGRLTGESSTNGTSTTYTYDTLDRVSSIREDVPDGVWLKRDYSYGAGSNVASVRYISQTDTLTTELYSYAYGHNTGITIPDGTVVFSLTAENDLGQPTAVATQGVTRQYGFNAYGMPTQRSMTKAGGGATLQNFSYIFNTATGNLISRCDSLHAAQENFIYDSLSRLTGASAAVNGSTSTRTYYYAANGNLTSGSGYGTILYGDADDPYKATTLIDTQGDTLAIPRQSHTYDAYDRPESVSTTSYQRTNIISFTYNGAGDRTVMTRTSRGHTGQQVQHRKYYIGSRYEFYEGRELLYLGGDAYSAPMVLEHVGSDSTAVYNIGRDYLGSITHIASADGTLVAEYSYDPWGRMRDPGTLVICSSQPSLFLDRGYTGHERLPWFSLYNMNARLYDPLVGRFLSPDPYVQAPDFTQNFNRYSYCLNNPLKYSDESGELFGIDDLIAGAVGGLINWATNGFKFTWEGLSYFGVGFAGGVASLYISPVLSSGLIAAANSAIGQGFGDNGKWNGSNINLGSVAFSGLTGAATSYLGGVMSSQISGFLSNITDNIAGKAWAGMINKGLTGFATGFTLGTGISLLNQYGSTGKVNMKLAAETGLSSGLSGLVLGGITGMGEGVFDARANGENPWALKDSAVKDASGPYSVYQGIDPNTNEVKYVGITKRSPEVRWAEHYSSGTERANLRFNVVSSGLTRMDARIQEQTLINQYGLENLYNKINSISPYYWEHYGIKP